MIKDEEESEINKQTSHIHTLIQTVIYNKTNIKINIVTLNTHYWT